MRAIAAAFALALSVHAAPAQAQETQPARNFTPIAATDRDGRDMMILVSEPRPGNPRPYRALVAWEGAPDRYWSFTFAFDCGTRKSVGLGSTARRWDGSEIDGSFPIAEMYRGYVDWLMAPAICEPKRDFLVPSYADARRFVRDFIDQGM